MALHLGRRENETATTEAPTARRWPWSPRPDGSRPWTRRPADGTADPAGAGEPPTRTVVVKQRPSRWRRMRHNPISLAILAAGIAAAAILVIGILLTLADANPSNALVHATLHTGNWLATPLHDAFPRSNPKHQLYLNWGITAGVYYVLARVLSWLTRF
ncbi:hypothetical protein DZF91_04630 [Actinomadura logoneensis]|uniref:Uncharacterized protein n=1 Tax=Actinomadura logoneensis TaxID=2293572 RepID=A0A372JSR2_9ACTN|nr:hypothetical protein [Actinomadura logoneensis]RFU42804.1 hypothetical protein DZF91_04630 [Actinomadura logoneensis]